MASRETSLGRLLGLSACSSRRPKEDLECLGARACEVWGLKAGGGAIKHVPPAHAFFFSLSFFFFAFLLMRVYESWADSYSNPTHQMHPLLVRSLHTNLTDTQKGSRISMVVSRVSYDVGICTHTHIHTPSLCQAPFFQPSLPPLSTPLSFPFRIVY